MQNWLQSSIRHQKLLMKSLQKFTFKVSGLSVKINFEGPENLWLKFIDKSIPNPVSRIEVNKFFSYHTQRKKKKRYYPNTNASQFLSYFKDTKVFLLLISSNWREMSSFSHQIFQGMIEGNLNLFYNTYVISIFLIFTVWTFDLSLFFNMYHLFSQ